MPRRAKYIDVKSLLEAVHESNGDPALKERAIAFLTCDFGSLRSESEIREAWAGLFCAIQLLAPLHAAYRHSLTTLLKTLQGFSTKNDSLLEVWEEARVKMVKVWDTCINVARHKMTPEAFEAARARLEQTARELRGEER